MINSGGIDFELSPEAEEPSFTPSGNDELQIEGDDVQKEETSVEIEQPVTEPEVTEEPISIEEQKQEEVIEEPVLEPVVEPVSEEQQENTTETTPIVPPTSGKEKKKKIKQPKETKESKKKGGFGWIIFILLLLLAGLGVWYYFTHNTKKTPKPAPVVEETQKTVDEPTVTPVDVPAEPMVIDTVPPAAPVPPEPRIATNVKVPRDWVIGYRATPDEVVAIKTVAELSYVDSLPCGYYWINDARHDGEKLFKIYVGPYKTKEEAEKALPAIQAKQPEAHIYTEDKRYKNK